MNSLTNFDGKYSMDDFSLSPFPIKNHKRKFGELYLGKHISTGEVFKIKKIPINHPNIDYIIIQLEKELNLNQTGLLTIKNNIIHNKDFIYPIYPYLEAQTIEKKSLSLAQFKSVFTQVLSQLNQIHSLGYLHGDIKPSNILIQKMDEQIVAHLIDYGQIIKIGENRNQSRPFSMIYSPPELVLKRTDLANPSSDLYSLGIAFLELMSNKKPFNDLHPEKVMAYMLNINPKKELSSLPQNWNKLISSLIGKEIFPLPPNHLEDLEIENILIKGIYNRSDQISTYLNLIENLETKRKGWFF